MILMATGFIEEAFKFMPRTGEHPNFMRYFTSGGGGKKLITKIRRRGKNDGDAGFGGKFKSTSAVTAEAIWSAQRLAIIFC